jgi:hypothetical protein
MTSIQIVPRRDLLAPNASSATREMIEAAYEPVHAAIARHKHAHDMHNAVLQSYHPYDAPRDVEKKACDAAFLAHAKFLETAPTSIDGTIASLLYASTELHPGHSVLSYATDADSRGRLLTAGTNYLPMIAAAIDRITANITEWPKTHPRAVLVEVPSSGKAA